MISIYRKDLPLKSMMTFFECKIDNPKMDKQIKKIIDKQGDRQQHKSNVKADMTEWRMQDKEGFRDLAEIIKAVAIKGSKERYNRDIDPEIIDMWGMKYKSNEHAVQHDHWPALWSFAYYLNAPKGAPGLYFKEMGDQGGIRNLEPGLLLMFPGYIRHEVKSTKFKGSRYVVSANVSEAKRNKPTQNAKLENLQKVIKLANYENLKV